MILSATILLEWHDRISMALRFLAILHLKLHGIVVVRATVWTTLVFPSASPRHWEVINDSGTILTGSQDISHARMVLIEATKLGYLAFIVLIALIKLQMLRCAVKVPLQGTSLLALWLLYRLMRHLRLQLKRDRLLHAVSRLQYFLIGGKLHHAGPLVLLNWLLRRILRHWQLSLAAQ